VYARERNVEATVILKIASNGCAEYVLLVFLSVSVFNTFILLEVTLFTFTFRQRELSFISSCILYKLFNFM
jgi:hypothetical protein